MTSRITCSEAWVQIVSDDGTVLKIHDSTVKKSIGVDSEWDAAIKKERESIGISDVRGVLESDW